MENPGEAMLDLIATLATAAYVAALDPRRLFIGGHAGSLKVDAKWEKGDVWLTVKHPELPSVKISFLKARLLLANFGVRGASR